MNKAVKIKYNYYVTVGYTYNLWRKAIGELPYNRYDRPWEFYISDDNKWCIYESNFTPPYKFSNITGRGPKRIPKEQVLMEML